MKKTYLQLVEHTEPFPHYALHEALIETGKDAPFWVSEEPLHTFNTYTEAVEEWGKKEKYFSSYLDIMSGEEIAKLHSRLEYTDEDFELIFD